jgi:hypothetical protein
MFCPEEEKKDAVILTGNYDRSAYVENLGNGQFKISELWQIEQHLRRNSK